MTLNGITCIGYQRVPDGFNAVLLNTSKEVIVALNPYTIEIAADNKQVVETFVGFGRATRIVEDLLHKQYEVFFPLDDGTQNRIFSLEQENAALKAQIAQSAETLAATQQALDFLLLNQPM